MQHSCSTIQGGYRSIEGGRIQEYTGADTGVFRGRYRSIQGRIQEYTGADTGEYRGRYRSRQGQIQEHSGADTGVYRGRFPCEV